jgi:hypothetical protein
MRQVTEQEYFAWAATEPLSNPSVDMQNVGEGYRDAPDYLESFWTRMLRAGRDAVAMRKEEQMK